MNRDHTNGCKFLSFDMVLVIKIDCLTLEVQIPTIPNREVRSSQILFRGICEACFSLN